MDFNRCYGCMRPKTGGPVCEHCGYQEGSVNGAHQLPVGTVLKEQYMVGKVLGQGGFGITYLGWDMYLDIPVAIKEYFPGGMVMRESTISLSVSDCGGDDGTRFRNNKERFLREAKMLARFSQVPEIVQIRNFFLTNNTAYIVMEYVEGITLKQYVKDSGGKLSVEETLTILGPVIEALSKVHKAGLVHRDISPDNIMMLPEGGAKLLDFGAVRDVGAAAVDKELTKSTEAILKQGYAPIEQYQKRGSLGPWTDVYALCATIYYCLTGEAPADAPERLLMEEELELEEKVPELTAAQRAALEHGLALRTEQRTGSMQQLQEELLHKEEPLPEPESAPIPEPAPAPKTEAKPAPKREPEQPQKKHIPPEEKTKAVSTRKPRGEEGEKKASDSVTKNVSKQEQKEETPQKEQKPPVRRETKKKKRFPFRLAAIGILIAAAAVLFSMLMSGDEEISVPFVDKRITGTCGTNAKWTLNPDTGALVITGSGIIAGIDPQGEGTAPWQEYREQITSVSITEDITTIGDYIFADLDNLKTVTIGSKVEVIGVGAFQHSAVDQVIFAAQTGESEETEQEPVYHLTEIKEDAFRETALKNIVLPDSVQILGSGAFAGCDELETATLGAYTVPCFDSWKDGVFMDVSEDFTLHCQTRTPAAEYAEVMGLSMTSTGMSTWDVSGSCGDTMSYHLDLETGFMKIAGSGAMWNYMDDDGTKESWDSKGLAPWKLYREKITTLMLSDGITSVGQYAFAHCNNLKSIHWGNTVSKLTFQSFMDTGVEKVVLPANITQIEHFTFNWCSQLEEIQLPESLPSLDEDAIAECKKLRRVWIGQKTQIKTKWDPTPFSCSEDASNTTVYNDLTIYGLQNSDAEQFAEKFGYDFKIGARDMEAEAEGQCGDNAWWFLSGDTLVLYGTGATWKYNLSAEDIEGWAKWDYQAGKAFMGHPKFWEKANDIRHIMVLPGLDELSNGLLSGMHYVRSIDFGTITKCYAELGYSRLKELTFPETLKTLGGWNFVSCSDLEKVTFLGPTTVEEMAFRACYSLKDIYFESGREQLRGELFLMDGTATTNMKSNITFHVRQYSAAETYAKKYGITYEILE